jgi:hypothetical protein
MSNERHETVSLEYSDIVSIGNAVKCALSEVENLLRQAVNTPGPNERDQMAVAIMQTLMQERAMWDGQYSEGAWLETHPRPRWCDPSGLRDRDEVLAERAYAMTDAMIKAKGK